MFLRNGRIILHLLLFVPKVTFISDITCHRSGLMRLISSKPPRVWGDRDIFSKKWCYSQCGFEHSHSPRDVRKVGPLPILLLERQRSYQFPVVRSDVGLAFELQK